MAINGNTSSLIVRPRTTVDFPQLQQALEECHAKTGYPLEGVKDARAFICDDQGPLEQAWVAEYNGEIVGHIAINAPLPDCPCVSAWRTRHPHDDSPIATVGRLFINPGRAKGVLHMLVDAVRTWSYEHNTRLVMYVVVWSPARALMADLLTARQNWAEFGRSIYHSPDGWAKDAVCYAAPVEWQTTLPIQKPRELLPEGGALQVIVSVLAGFQSKWQALYFLACATYSFGQRQFVLNFLNFSWSLKKMRASHEA